MRVVPLSMQALPYSTSSPRSRKLHMTQQNLEHAYKDSLVMFSRDKQFEFYENFLEPLFHIKLVSDVINFKRVFQNNFTCLGHKSAHQSASSRDDSRLHLARRTCHGGQPRVLYTSISFTIVVASVP